MGAAEVGCVEAHGTGTALGDPTEAGSMAAVYLGSDRASPLGLGAAKGNIGHSEAASGMMGMVRAQQVLCARQSSGNAHLRPLNPLIAARLQGVSGRALMPLMSQDLVGAAACGVSSFGFSGTIAHAVQQAHAEGGKLAMRSRLAYQSARFPWLQRIETAAPSEEGQAAFYCMCWQLAVGSTGQTAGAPTSVMVVQARCIGAAGRAMIAARRAGLLPTSGERTPSALSAVVVLLDAAETVGPSLQGTKTSVSVVQQLMRLGSTAPQLLLLTGGVQASSPMAGAATASTAAHGGAWGLGRVLRLEQPSWRVVNADLLADSQLATAAGELVVEGAGAGAASELVWRGGERLAATLTRHAAVGGASVRGVTSSSYVITGGLGGLGLRAASFVVERGARALYLSSRSGVAWQESADALSSLSGQLGVSIMCVACDAADTYELLALGHAAAGLCSTVLHAAGALRDTLLRSMRTGDIVSVFGPKAGSAAQLQHMSTRGGALRELLFFSSTTSLIGTVGQGNYAAANSHLDAVAI